MVKNSWPITRAVFINFKPMTHLKVTCESHLHNICCDYKTKITFSCHSYLYYSQCYSTHETTANCQSQITACERKLFICERDLKVKLVQRVGAFAASERSLSKIFQQKTFRCVIDFILWTFCLISDS